MAKLRAPATSIPATRAVVSTEIPEHLQVWYMDDWIGPDEQPPPYLKDHSGLRDPSENLWMSRVMTSRARYRAAVREWAADLESRGVKPPPLPRPGRPRFRRPIGER
jgi:hypothetical protein